MHAPGIWGILIIAIVVILLFGRGKISGLMSEVASGIKAFQKGIRDEDKPADRIEQATTPVTPREAGVEARETDKSKDA